MPEIRTYRHADETSWLRCRILAFLDTDYYDDVWVSRPDDSAIQFVAADGDTIVGILDICIDGALATIDTICIHPDHRREGLASRLLAEATRCLPAEITTLDAWTREDAGTLAWYRSQGLSESDHYLHVVKGWDEPDAGWTAPAPLSAPATAFCHAPLEHEAQLRAAFARVYVCRRFSRPVVRA